MTRHEQQPHQHVPAEPPPAKKRPPLSPEQYLERPLTGPERAQWASVLRRVRDANHERPHPI